MQILKKFMGVLVCLSISTYGMPIFAISGSVSSGSRILLSETDMEAAVGGSLHTEILSTGMYDGDQVKALVAMGGGLNGNSYSLEVINLNGDVVRTLASGTINRNEARIISGAREAGESAFRVKLTNNSYPGIAAQDTEFPIDGFQ